MIFNTPSHYKSITRRTNIVPLFLLLCSPYGLVVILERRWKGLQTLNEPGKRFRSKFLSANGV